MKSQRLPIEKAKWFVMNRGSGEYCDFGFGSKAQALTEVSFLNAKDRAAGGKGEFAVTPSKPRPPPALTVLKGGKP